MGKKNIKENLVYLVIWILLALTPILSMMLRIADDSSMSFSWHEVTRSWRVFVPYFIVFLIHNYLAAPLLIYKKKSLLYLALTLSIIFVFQLYECSNKPDNGHRPHDFAFQQHRKDCPPEFPDEGFTPEPPESDMGNPPTSPPPHHKHSWFEPGPRDHRDGPPVLLGQQNIVALIIIILMIGMNLGVKFYFKTSKEAKAMELLEKKNLEQQLEYLKYQINPHFFMNTLNNIHALVDIEPEEAKHSILELSRMMRYVLHDGAKGQVLLRKDIDFLKHYIALMKLRYTDKVRINVNMPEDLVDKLVPPMLFITFVENAFKHGVSYRKASFIEVSINTTDERVSFSCRNSKAGNENEGPGGVGLANTRQRLELIYGNDYTLNIDDGEDIYQVNLDIPFLTPEQTKA